MIEIHGKIKIKTKRTRLKSLFVLYFLMIKIFITKTPCTQVHSQHKKKNTIEKNLTTQFCNYS